MDDDSCMGLIIVFAVLSVVLGAIPTVLFPALLGFLVIAIPIGIIILILATVCS